MLEWIKLSIEWMALGVELVAGIVIAVAVVETLLKIAPLAFRREELQHAKMAARLALGRWLAVALELTLAADILRTAIAPTWDDIGKLAAIAVLRTALNFFLEREISREKAE
jgi:uncharacterized membrane protein